MVWVLDPQKYADAAVHRRFLVPMAGHSEVIAVVLNQSDLLAPEQVDECVHDLRRLLDSEEPARRADPGHLRHSPGPGSARCASCSTETVSARRAAAARISADVDAVAARFLPYAGEDPQAR